MRLGPYAIEQDYSQYLANASDIIYAIVGTATKGPIGVPTVCTSNTDFVNKFGTLSPNCMGTYAAQYYLNTSGKIYYVRVATEDANKATTSVAGAITGSVPTTDALVFSAKSEGSYYNDYSLDISNVVAEGDTYKFDILVKNAKGIVVESIQGILLSSLSKQVDAVVVPVPESISSKYIELTSVIANLVTVTAGNYKLSGGTDGIENITSAEFINALDKLKNSNYDWNLLAVPGISDPEVVVAGLDMVSSRGDGLYLVDSPNGLDAKGIEDWHNGSGEYSHEKFNNSYGALYWSWQKIYDAVNKIYVEVPPSVVIAPVINNSANMSEVWYAPAGLKRGIVHGVIEPVVAPDKSVVDHLYTGDNAVNCIITDPQVGLCVFGQKTLSRENSALNRVNVRLLLNYLKRVVVAACRTLTFDPNDRITWGYFEDKVEPTLRNIKAHRGIYEYRIVKGERIVTDEDIDNYRMPAMIAIKPTKTAEEIPIYFTITSTGADFNSVLESNGIVIE